MPGKWDTRAAWEGALPGAAIANNLVTSNTSTAWIRTYSHWHLLTIFVYAQIRIMSLAINIVGAAVSYTLIEVLSFDVPANKILNQQAADTRVVEDVRSMFPLRPQLVVVASLAPAVNQLPAGETGGLTAQSNFNAATAADIAALIPDADAAWAFCQLVARVNYANQSQSWVTTIYVSFLAAIAKMGNATDAFLNKISNRALTELNVYFIDQIWDAEVIRNVWSIVGEFVNENNMQAAVDHWVGAQGIIPAHAIAIRTLIQQIAGEGLTALATIKKALLTTPNFQWNVIAAYFPAEMTAIHNAFTLIGNNQYYGYIKNNIQIKSTLYKNVAWVAKELLIRLGGNQSLTKYKGWVRVPMHVNALTTLIDNYVNNIPPPNAANVANGVNMINNLVPAAQAATGIIV